MRTPTLALSIATLSALLAVSNLACQGDPDDPMTWAKQLKDLRTQKITARCHHGAPDNGALARGEDG